MAAAKRGYKLQEFVAHASDVNCLNIGKKSHRVFLTGGVDRKVNLWEVGKPTSLLSLAGHTSSVESVTFDSAEVLVLAGSYCGTIKLWDLEEAKIVRTLAGHRASCTTVEFHPFGEFFASGSSDTDLKIWDIRKKGCIHTYKGHTQGIRTIRFTPDGRWVVSGGEDNVVKLWDLTAGKLLHEFKFHTGLIQSIDFHPHEFLLATGSADRTVKFWDLETFELIGSSGPEATGVRSMVFHPDGKNLFCGLDETLKVLSWEPIRCHDAVDMGWSILGDLSICEGKILGCSYHESSVGVWVADISLIGPYAAGIRPRSSGLLEPIFSPGASRSFHQIDASTKSSTPLINREHDCGIEAKETVKSIYVTSKDDVESATEKSNSMSDSKITPKSSIGLKGNKGNANRHIASQNVDANVTPKGSTLISKARREIKSTESCSGTPRRIDSSLASKRTTLNSAGFSGSSLLDSKNSMEVRRGTNIQVMNRFVSTPVIVPRESPDLRNSANTRTENASTDMDGHGMILCKPTHTRKASYASGGSGTENQLMAAESGSKNDTGNCLPGLMDMNFLSKLVVNDESAASNEQNHTDRRPAADKFNRIVSSVPPDNKCTESPCSTTDTSSVMVKGVAIQHGRTRSLVESWEMRERSNGSFMATINSSSNVTPETASLSPNPNEQIQTSERELTSEDDDCGPNVLLQSHDLFVNVLKSRLTKLQVVRHFWEQNGIKGAINAVGKLPDHSVQIDVISVLMEKSDLFTLDLFSLLLPLLVGLLSSKTERHADVSLEMLLKLVRMFGVVIRSTMSGSSLVGVDIEAEQRLNRCRLCFNQLEQIRQILPSLIRKGGSIAKHAVELNLTLQE